MYTEFTVSNDGVDLYCRRSGNGIPLLMIHGVCIDCDFWRETSEYLSREFLVATYDRRGYSRSAAPADNDYSIETQANDAARIIQQIGHPVNVIAHSGGTIIALELISNFPELIRQAVLYEPPVFELLNGDNELLKELYTITDLINECRYTKALNRFWPLLGNRDKRARLSSDEEMDNILENSKTFIRYEFDSTFYYHPKYELLKASQIYIAVGDLSLDTSIRSTASILAEKLSCELVYYPGMHNCAFDLPGSFAYMSAGILRLGSRND